MKVTGFVKNLPDGRVRTLDQCGDSEVLDEFAKVISLRSPPIFVEGEKKKTLKSHASSNTLKLNRVLLPKRCRRDSDRWSPSSRTAGKTSKTIGGS